MSEVPKRHKNDKSNNRKSVPRDEKAIQDRSRKHERSQPKEEEIKSSRDGGILDEDAFHEDRLVEE